MNSTSAFQIHANESTPAWKFHLEVPRKSLGDSETLTNQVPPGRSIKHRRISLLASQERELESSLEDMSIDEIPEEDIPKSIITGNETGKIDLTDNVETGNDETVNDETDLSEMDQSVEPEGVSLPSEEKVFDSDDDDCSAPPHKALAVRKKSNRSYQDRSSLG